MLVRLKFCILEFASRTNPAESGSWMAAVAFFDHHSFNGGGSVGWQRLYVVNIPNVQIIN